MKKLKILAVFMSILLIAGSVYAASPSTLKKNVWNAEQVFKQGITAEDFMTLDGASVLTNTSKVFYVRSTTGANTLGNNQGLSYSKPWATVDYAINQTTASVGDVIIVLPYHVETIAAADGFDADVAGISIIGIGNFTSMPTFTLSETASTVAIGAANVTLKNLSFKAGKSAVVMGVSVEAGGDDTVIDSCFFPEPATSTFEFVRAILLAAGADRVTIQNCIAYSADATGATNFVDMDTGVNNGTRLINNWIYGEYAEGAIHSDQTDLDVTVWGNIITNLTTGQHGIEFTSGALGVYGENYVYTDTEAASIDPGSLKAVAPNWVATAINASPNMFPADTSPRSIQNVSKALPASTQSPIFTIVGGPIEIISLTGIVTTGIQAQSCSLKVVVDPTTPATDTDISAVLEVTGDLAGTAYSIVTSIATALAEYTYGVGPTMGGVFRIHVPIGNIEVSTNATNTGNITWSLLYQPLAPGVIVTAP